MYFSHLKTPDKIAIIVNGENYTYARLYTCSINLAGFLVNSGVKKGDRVLIFMNNSWECIVSIYGISLAGAVFTVINPQTKANKLEFIINDCRPKFIICEDTIKNVVYASLKGVKDIPGILISKLSADQSISPHQTYTKFEEAADNKKMQTLLPRVIPNDLSALIYTSGSTGFPKGVTMTHQSMVFTCWSLIEYLRLDEDERIIITLPLAFDYGLYQLLMSVTIGGTLIVEQSFNFPPTIFRQIEKLKPSVFPGVPTIYAMMIATHKKTGIVFESVRKITNTAAALPEEFIPDLKKIFPNALIFKMYGLTECKRVSYLEPEMIDLKPNSVGKAIPGTEVFLLSEKGEPVPPGEPGILHIRGPHIMVGYWNNETLTNEMLKPGLIPGEKILCANDWFVMDAEGYLYFYGRNDDIIKTRGEKVSPVEIENVLYKNEAVREVAVIGIPDAILGEQIIAFINIYENKEISEKSIQQHCMTFLESFMIPNRIIFLNEMPKNTNGKIDKKELKKNLIGDGTA